MLFFFEELLNNPRKETKNVPQMQSTKNPAAVAFVGIYLSASQFDARSDSVWLVLLDLMFLLY